MTPRQRILTLLGGGKPDRVPWFGDLDYYATSLIHRGEKPKDFKLTEDYIRWHEELGVGFYLQGFFPFRTIIENCEVKDYQDGDCRVREVVTPKGTLCEKWQWMPQSYTEGPVEHLVKSAADLPAYRSVFENTRYEPDYEFAEIRKKQIGEAGALLAYLPKSPLMQMVALDAGIEAFMDIFMNAPDELEKTIAAVRKSHDIAAKISVDSPADILMIPENLSSEVVGPHLFELYMKDYQQSWARQIKQAGKFSCIHMDGSLKGLLREESAVGLTFLEAMTPGPVGDLGVEQWEEFCQNDDVIFWGGIPGCYFTDMISDDEFEGFVRHVLSVMRKSNRFVLGIADQAPPDTIENRIIKVGEIVKEYGKYL